ncbi:MAG: hypothetical protein ACLFQV_11290 [Vulcanimicrobiota bacterium]
MKTKKILIILILVACISVFPARAQTVKTQEEAEKIFKDVRSRLAKLGISLDREILLKLRTVDEIHVQHNSTGGRAVNIGGYYQPFNPETIWIIQDKSREYTYGVLAHEFGHAWQSSNAPLQDRMIKEGFAEWCEYQILKSLGASHCLKQMENNPDPDYGGGLRLFLAVEKKEGLKGLLEFARTQQNPPDWFKDPLKK